VLARIVIRVEPHFLPPYGFLRPQLRDESATLHSELARVGEVDRQQGLLHLGLVAEAWTGVRHTRWDYTALTLDLAERCKDVVSLKSPVTLPSRRKMSSRQELIQCWALLMNVGHLHWTFETERLLVEALRWNQSRKKSPQVSDLLLAVPESIRDWAEAILSEKQRFRIFQVLAFSRLQHLPLSDGVRRLAIDVLTAQHAPPGSGEALDRSRELFRRIRRLAFLTLDSDFSPAPLSVPLSRVLSQPLLLAGLLSPESSDDELVSLERYLTRRIYLGTPVLTARARRVKRLRSQVRRAIGKNLAEALDLLATNRVFVEAGRPTDHEPMLRLELDLDSLIVQMMYSGGDLNRVDTAAKRLKSQVYRRNGRLIVNHSIDASGSFAVFQIHSRPGATVSRAVGILAALEWLADTGSSRGDFAQSGDEFASLLALQEQLQVFGAVAQSTIEASLQLLFPDVAEWRWGERVGGVRAVLVNHNSHTDVTVLLDALGQRVRRKHQAVEIAAVRRRLPTSVAVASISSVVALDGEGAELAELDGVVISEDSRGRLKCVLMEAKTGKSALGKAQTAMVTKAETLGVQRWMSRSSVQSERQKGMAIAWVEYRFPGAVLSEDDEESTRVVEFNSKRGDWVVRRLRARRASSRHPTQRAAETRAIEITARLRRGQVLVLGRDGRLMRTREPD